MAFPVVPLLIGFLAGTAFGYLRGEHHPGRAVKRTRYATGRPPLPVDAEPVENTTEWERRADHF